MNETKYNDEVLLIDYLLGRCDLDVARQVGVRLEKDETFQRLHDDLANTFGALRLTVEPQQPEGLAEKTLLHIRAARRTEALLAKEELARPAVRPTFSGREVIAAAAAVLLMAIIFLPSIREAREEAVMAQCGARVGQIGTAQSN